MTTWTGTQDADAYAGTTDADTLDGAGGNDTLVGNGGLDQIAGGEGDDRLEGAGTLDGGVGADTITSYGGGAYGGADGDHITLEYGAGDVWGGAGDDVVTLEIYSTAGVLDGGDGYDTLEVVSSGVISHFNAATSGFEALNAASSLFYGADDATIGDTVDFGGLKVTSPHGLIMDLRGGDDTFHGSDANDAAGGGQGADELHGGLGDDTLDGQAGDDRLYGEDGDDSLYGADGHDAVYGGVGNDTLHGLAATLDGGDGDDVISAEGDRYHGVNNVIGGAGNDIVHLWGFTDALQGGLGDDTLQFQETGFLHDFSAANGFEHVVLNNGVLGFDGADDRIDLSGMDVQAEDRDRWFDGYGGNDTIVGTAANDTIDGSAGDDTVDGGAGGNDALFGGAVAGEHNNTASFAHNQQAVNVDLNVVDKSQPVVVDNGWGQTKLYDIQNIIGSGFADILHGTYGNEQLDGGAGDDRIDGAGSTFDGYVAGVHGSGDTLIGGDGNDTIMSGVGLDHLVGGTGADTYVYRTVGDFVPQEDNYPKPLPPGHTGFAPAAVSSVDTEYWETIAPDTQDTLDFSNLKGDQSGDWAFNYIGSDDAVFDASHEMRIVHHDGVTELQFNWVDPSANPNNQYSKIFLMGTFDLAETAPGSMMFKVQAYVPPGAPIEGGEGNDALKGSVGHDRLLGHGGNDTLNGMQNADTMVGGAGDDVYYVDNAGDGVVEQPGEGFDTVHVQNVNWTLDEGSSVEKVIAEGLAFTVHGNSQDQEVGGSNLVNTLYGEAGNDSLYGAGGSDTLYGGAGTDTLNGGVGADVMSGDGGNDTYYVENAGDRVVEAIGSGNDIVISSISYRLEAGQEIEALTGNGFGNLNLTGNEFAQAITGTDGANVLDGGLNAAIYPASDTLIGGGGNDVYIVRNPGDVVVEQADGGIDTVKTDLSSYTLGANLEILTYTGSAGAHLVGNGLNNTITGGVGADQLEGGGGADKLAGGLGDDFYFVTEAHTQVFEAANAGHDTVLTQLASYTLGANVEDLEAFGTTDFFGMGNNDANVIAGARSHQNALYGLNGNDKLMGGDVADTLDGGVGSDTAIGGGGDDTYFVDNAGDHVVEAAGGGYDRIFVGSNAFVLDAGQEVEELDATGSGSNLHGNDHAQKLVGNGYANVLDGGVNQAGPVDTLEGGAGNDTYVLHDYSTVVVEQSGGGIDTEQTDGGFLSLADNVEIGLYTGHASVTLYGNALDNTLTGGDGDDVFQGNGGTDRMVGGGGNDTYFTDIATDLVVEQAGGGHDVVKTGATSFTLSANVEDLVDIGWRDFTGTGNASDNLVQGGAFHHNILHGAGGNDTLVGGDLADSLYGDGGDDVVYGGGGDDYIKSLSGEGHDTIDGGTGTDLLTLERTAETHDLRVDLTLTGVQQLGDYSTGANGTTFANIEKIRFAGGSGADYARGGDLDDVLKGNGGSDTLVGGGGNDVLQGGAGHDALTGGAGADTFRLDGSGADSDAVFDFSRADGDKLALSKAAFGITSLDGVLVDDHAGGVVAHNGGYFISFDTTGHELYLFSDDAHGDHRLFLAYLDGVDSLSAGDFTLF